MENGVNDFVSPQDGGGVSITSGPLGRAFRTWFDYSEAAENLVHLTHEGLGEVMKTPELYTILEFSQERIDRAKWKAEQARKEVEAEFPNLHAHSLLGLCGALESFVEDLFVCQLEADHDLLGNGAFSRVRLPVTVLTEPNERSKYALILAEVSRSTNADLKVGASRYEAVLELVGLSGAIPRQVRNSLHQMQQVRNVWAHRGGYVDQRFLDACPNLGYALGQRIELGPETFSQLMHGAHMYGVVIANRYFLNSGSRPVAIECAGYEGCLSEVFTDMRKPGGAARPMRRSADSGDSHPAAKDAAPLDEPLAEE